jgi:hypothetical protein
VNGEVIDHLFYRFTRLAGRRAAGRRPGETWREWVFGLEGPGRLSAERALDVFERSKYGGQGPTPGDFAILEEAIRELRGS